MNRNRKHSHDAATGSPPRVDALPADRCSMAELLKITAMTKNTFFLRYRNAPAYAELLDVQFTPRGRLHVARAAAEQIACERRQLGKTRHGNKGRQPSRPCPTCRRPLHPRHTYCDRCTWAQDANAASGPDTAPNGEGC